MTTLEPCPFCGDVPIIRNQLLEHPFRRGCPLGEIKFYTGSFEAWNTREAATRIEALADMVRRLAGVVDNFIQDSDDPGSEALAAHYCARQLLNRLESLQRRACMKEDDVSEWQPIETAKKDGQMLWLAVDYSGGLGGENDPDHPLADARIAATIGFNQYDDNGEDEWLFAGWCWTHDHFTQGRGKVIAWRPIGFELSLDSCLARSADCPAITKGSDDLEMRTA